MILLSIDPGNTESAWMLYDTETREPFQHAKEGNEQLINRLRFRRLGTEFVLMPDTCVIEDMACYGMAVGKEVMDTLKWIGRFQEAWSGSELPSLLYRREVKHHLCNSVKAKDSNVRQVLIDLYGGKAKAIGCKAQPGPLYGISADRWSALAIAVTFADTKLPAPRPEAHAVHDAAEASA